MQTQSKVKKKKKTKTGDENEKKNLNYIFRIDLAKVKHYSIKQRTCFAYFIMAGTNVLNLLSLILPEQGCKLLFLSILTFSLLRHSAASLFCDFGIPFTFGLEFKSLIICYALEQEKGGCEVDSDHVSFSCLHFSHTDCVVT